MWRLWLRSITGVRHILYTQFWSALGMHLCYFHAAPESTIMKYDPPPYTFSMHVSIVGLRQYNHLTAVISTCQVAHLREMLRADLGPFTVQNSGEWLG